MSSNVINSVPKLKCLELVAATVKFYVNNVASAVFFLLKEFLAKREPDSLAEI